MTEEEDFFNVDNIPTQVIADHPIVDNKHPKLVDGQCAKAILKGPYGDRFKLFSGRPHWWTGKEWEYMNERNLFNFITDSLPKRYRNMSRIKQVQKMFLYRMPISSRI